jgi:hypothetical protein
MHLLWPLLYEHHIENKLEQKIIRYAQP